MTINFGNIVRSIHVIWIYTTIPDFLRSIFYQRLSVAFDFFDSENFVKYHGARIILFTVWDFPTISQTNHL